MCGTTKETSIINVRDVLQPRYVKRKSYEKHHI